MTFWPNIGLLNVAQIGLIALVHEDSFTNKKGDFLAEHWPAKVSPDWNEYLMSRASFTKKKTDRLHLAGVNNSTDR